MAILCQLLPNPLQMRRQHDLHGQDGDQLGYGLTSRGSCDTDRDAGYLHGVHWTGGEGGVGE